MNRAADTLHHGPVEMIAILCVILFLTGGCLFLILVLVSRLWKTRADARDRLLSELVQRKLNVFILLANDNVPRRHFQWRYHTVELKDLLRKSGRHQLIIDLLMANSRNLTGRSALVLRRLYVRLALRRFSLAKLRHRNIHVRIQGLNELSEMGIVDALEPIRSFVVHRDNRLREASFMAMVKLSGSAPFSMLRDYHGPVSDWVQIMLHKHLTRLHPDKLPDFSAWIHSANPAVRMFAIRMIVAFRQLESASTLASLLEDTDTRMARMAADALGQLEASEHGEQVAEFGRRHPGDEPCLESALRALAKIGDPQRHRSFLAWHMIHGSYRLRVEAMRALIKLKLDPLTLLIDFNPVNDPEFSRIHAHLTNPLLS